MAKLVKDVWHKQKLSTACGSLVWFSLLLGAKTGVSGWSAVEGKGCQREDKVATVQRNQRTAFVLSALPPLLAGVKTGRILPNRCEDERVLDLDWATINLE